MNKPITQYADLPGIKLAYTRSGRGPVLILLHGNSESKKLFRAYQNRHFADYDTVAIDSRGHGESVSEDAEYSIGQYSEDVLAFCRHQGITKAFLVGYSDGGNIALFLAKKAPQLFEKIVAISPNTRADGTEEKTLKLFRSIMKVFFFLRKVGFDTKKSIMRFNLMLNDIGLPDDDLRSIRANVTILYAERDMIKEDHIRNIAGLIPNAKLKKIMGCNHLNILNQPETIAEIRNYFVLR